MQLIWAKGRAPLSSNTKSSDIAELQAEIAALTAIIRQYEHEARSPKSEAHPDYPNAPPRKPSTRKRGPRPGQKKTPRRDYQHLPTVDRATRPATQHDNWK